MNKALLIGVNEYATQTPLAGCVDDAVDLACLLRGRAVDVIVLTDKDATKQTIVDELSAMVEGLLPGERGYFHFSGHGVRMASEHDDAGMDEVLCPHDFAWTRETAISDHELVEIVERLDPDARLIVSLDACYSGEFLSGVGLQGKLAAPAGMTARGPTVCGFRSIAHAPNVTFVSACAAWETATDTSFDGRPNGAFTYYFTTALHAYGDSATLGELVTAIAEPLRTDAMTPVAENADVRFFAPPRTYASPLRRLLPMTDVVAFERRWETALLDQPLDVDVRIVAANDELVAFVVARVFGSTLTSSPIRITGDLVYPIELGFFGMQLELAISEWSGAGIDFVLQLELASHLPFVPRVPIANEAVHVDAARLATPCAFIPRRMQLSLLRARPSTSPSGPSAPPVYRLKTDSP